MQPAITKLNRLDHLIIHTIYLFKASFIPHSSFIRYICSKQDSFIIHFIPSQTTTTHSTREDFIIVTGAVNLNLITCWRIGEWINAVTLCAHWGPINYTSEQEDECLMCFRLSTIKLQTKQKY